MLNPNTTIPYHQETGYAINNDYSRAALEVNQSVYSQRTESIYSQFLNNISITNSIYDDKS
jgi:hypothetical protein